MQFNSRIWDILNRNNFVVVRFDAFDSDIMFIRNLKIIIQKVDPMKPLEPHEANTKIEKPFQKGKYINNI